MGMASSHRREALALGRRVGWALLVLGGPVKLLSLDFLQGEWDTYRDRWASFI
jgi:hypothetical protein